MKFINLVFVLLFLFSAAVQYNDPDPFVWVPIYLYGALLCLLAFRKIFLLSLYIPGFSFYICYAVYLFFGEDGVLAWIRERGAENLLQNMNDENPWIETFREFFGLMLLLLALSINTFWRYGFKRLYKTS